MGAEEVHALSDAELFGAIVLSKRALADGLADVQMSVARGFAPDGRLASYLEASGATLALPEKLHHLRGPLA